MLYKYLPHRSYIPVGCSILGLAVLSCAYSHAYARDGFSYRLRASSVYDTNPLTRGDSSSDDAIFGVETTASVVFTQETASQLLDADLSFTRNQFDESDFNSNDASLSVRARKQLKRWVLSFMGRGALDTTRSSSTDISGKNNVVAGRRTSFSVNPSLVYNYSQRGTIGLNSSLDQKYYADETLLTDHRTYSFSPFIGYQIDPLQSVSLALLYQNYQSLSGADVEVESFGPFMTWEYSVSRNLRAEVSLGLLRAEFSGFGTSGGSETNPIYSVRLEYEGDVSVTSLSLERARQASSNGSELDVTTVGVANRFEVSPRWDLSLGAEYKDAEQSGFSNSNLDTSYTGVIGTTYDISRQLKFSTSYRYVNNDFTDNGGDASRSVIRAGLEYSLY